MESTTGGNLSESVQGVYLVLLADHSDGSDDDYPTFAIYLETANFEESEDRTHCYIYGRRNVSC
jgi:hypothetical protein